MADYKSDISFLKLEKKIAIKNNDPVNKIVINLMIKLDNYK